MKTFRLLIVGALVAFLFQNCTIIHPGEVGVDVKLGKAKDNLLMPGPHHYAPKLLRHVVRYETRTINHNKEFHFHSSEGIYVDVNLTILYHIRVDSVLSVHKNYGPYYESLLIDDYAETFLRKIGLKYEAQDLISNRNAIEKDVMEHLTEVLGPRGIVTESIMLKDFHLPPDIIQTIQARLKAEEIAKKTHVENKVAREQLDFQLERGLKEKELEISKKRLDIEFALEQQKIEAERIIVQAEAEARQQELQNEQISDQLLKLRAIELSAEALKGSSKFILTDGKTPIVLGGNGVNLFDVAGFND